MVLPNAARKQSTARAIPNLEAWLGFGVIMSYCYFALLLLLSISLIFVFAKVNDVAFVKIDDDRYSVLERPLAGSQLVQEVREEIRATIDIDEMPKDLSLVAKYFQLAENGLVSYPRLQGKVKVSQIQILRLADKSDVAITNFARVSKRILDDLESTYYYLYNGNTKMAKLVYTALSDDVEEMANNANELYKQYQEEVDKLTRVLEETFGAQQTETDRQGEAKAERRRLKADIEKLNVLKEEMHKKFLHMEQLFNEAKRKEMKALKKDNNPFKMLANFVTSKFVGMKFFDLGPHTDVAQAYRTAKLQYMSEMEKVRESKSSVLASMAEFAQRMKNTDSEEELAQIAIAALQNAIGDLEQVIAVLANAARFWNDMKIHLEDLKQGDEFKHATSNELNDEEREEVIQSPKFKKAAVVNYAKWVATYEMTRQFRAKMRPAREELANTVKSNLNKQQAMENIKKLGSELEAEGRRRRIAMEKTSKDEL